MSRLPQHLKRESTFNREDTVTLVRLTPEKAAPLFSSHWNQAGTRSSRYLFRASVQHLLRLDAAAMTQYPSGRKLFNPGKWVRFPLSFQNARRVLYHRFPVANIRDLINWVIIVFRGWNSVCQRFSFAKILFSVSSFSGNVRLSRSLIIVINLYHCYHYYHRRRRRRHHHYYHFHPHHYHIIIVVINIISVIMVIIIIIVSIISIIITIAVSIIIMIIFLDNFLLILL